ncbi:mariner Mos1 transposase [Trichonephila clavipes]|uniref:Mariner Mos1 transposase n=1 Tax=Trichonephila clavipes TaxID=2585209 RepID=A0A8X7BK94_TRICX|nr:mariner Mos1 transposase [Trichonephila clavipes]
MFSTTPPSLYTAFGDTLYIRLSELIEPPPEAITSLTLQGMITICVWVIHNGIVLHLTWRSHNLFSLNYGPILKCLAPPQPTRMFGVCNQRLMMDSKTMETKQICFFGNDFPRNNSPRGLLELIEYIGHWFGVVFPNFFRRNEERGRPPKQFEDAELQALLDEDDDQTQEHLAEQLNVNQSTVSRHLKAMGKIIKVGRSVPHELTDCQQENRNVVCEMLLARYKRKSYLHRIVRMQNANRMQNIVCKMDLF